MRTMRTKWTMAAAVAAMLACVAAAGAQERKIKRSALPPAVERTVAAQSAGATIKGFSKEKENSATYYEAEMIVNGHVEDVSMLESGEIAEVEEQVEKDTLPGAVKAALLAKAGKGRITKVESITNRSKLVAYEAQIRTNGKRSEVQVGPNGETLSHEE